MMTAACHQETLSMLSSSLGAAWRRALLTAGLILATAAVPAVAGDAAALVLEGGTVHPISAEPFAGHVVIQGGRITGAGSEAVVPEGARRVDATGLHVYPGIFDAVSSLGMVEIGAVTASNDQAEMGAYNPHLHAATAIHPASDLIPVARANGITHSMVAPRTGNEGVIAGQGVLVHLDGWTVEEMTLAPALAMGIAWPRIQTRRFDFATFTVKETPFNEAREKAEEAVNELRDWLDAARHYHQAQDSGSQRLSRDARLAGLSRILEGRQTVVIFANSKRDIEAALDFAEEEGLRMVLAGGRDAWQLREVLAEKQIPVILGMTQSLPSEEDHAYDQPYRAPGMLADAGVKIAFASGAGGGFGPGGPHSSRTIPFEAAAAVAYGLDEAEALRALTLNPAEMLGVDDRLGSIEAGKVANLMVTDGSPLLMTTQVRHLVINGRLVNTGNRHQRLYETYRGR